MSRTIVLLCAAVGISGAVAACSSSDEGGAPPVDSGAPADSSSGGDGGIPPDDAAGDVDDRPVDGAAGDSGPVSVFVDGSVPDGGNPPTPGVVDCGGHACTASTSTCCAPATPEADGGFSCDADGANVACASHVTQECDETADCPSGLICCAATTDGPYVETTCFQSCQIRPGSHQVCKVNGECHNGNPCVPQTCSGQLIGLCSQGGNECR